MKRKAQAKSVPTANAGAAQSALGELVRRQTAARLKILGKKIAVAAKDPRDAENVHDLRVAIRRLTQCLRLFEAFFDPARAKKIHRRLKKLMERCGATRNYDIALELLRSAGVKSEDLAAHLLKERKRNERKMAAALRKWRKGVARDWSRRLKVTAPLREALPTQAPVKGVVWNIRATVAENAARVLPGMADALFEAGARAAVPGAKYEELHRFRIAGKRFRYTLELFQDVYGVESGRMLAEMKKLQDMLGGINDCVTSIELVRRNRTAATALRKVMNVREQEFRAYWMSAGSAEAREWWVARLGESWIAAVK